MTKRKEIFEITGWARRYDRETGKFVVNISYETAAPKPSKRVVAVAESFGLGLDKWEKFVYVLLIQSITSASNPGPSTLVLKRPANSAMA